MIKKPCFIEGLLTTLMIPEKDDIIKQENNAYYVTKYVMPHIVGSGGRNIKALQKIGMYKNAKFVGCDRVETVEVNYTEDRKKVWFKFFETYTYNSKIILKRETTGYISFHINDLKRDLDDLKWHCENYKLDMNEILSNLDINQ